MKQPLYLFIEDVNQGGRGKHYKDMTINDFRVSLDELKRYDKIVFIDPENNDYVLRERTGSDGEHTFNLGGRIYSITDEMLRSAFAQAEFGSTKTVVGSTLSFNPEELDAAAEEAWDKRHPKTLDADRIATVVASTWNQHYPDRSPWDSIGEGARKEWLEVFTLFDRINATYPQRTDGHAHYLVVGHLTGYDNVVMYVRAPTARKAEITFQEAFTASLESPPQEGLEIHFDCVAKIPGPPDSIWTPDGFEAGGNISCEEWTQPA